MKHRIRGLRLALIAAAVSLALPAGEALSRDAAPRQYDETEVQTRALGTWSGKWTSDVYGGKGEVLINVESAGNGRLAGKGTSSGGPCDREFTMTGAYQGSLVQLQLDFPQGGEGCAAGKVRMSLTMGSKGNQAVAVGHWAVTEGGPGAGKLYGIITLYK